MRSEVWELEVWSSRAHAPEIVKEFYPPQEGNSIVHLGETPK
jgi:hypothetical protein